MNLRWGPACGAGGLVKPPQRICGGAPLAGRESRDSGEISAAVRIVVHAREPGFPGAHARTVHRRHLVRLTAAVRASDQGLAPLLEPLEARRLLRNGIRIA